MNKELTKKQKKNKKKRISPYKHSWSYAKHKQETFILYKICKTKSLPNFVSRYPLEIVKAKYTEPQK